MNPLMAFAATAPDIALLRSSEDGVSCYQLVETSNDPSKVNLAGVCCVTYETITVAQADPLQVLQQYWGYSQFRPMQAEIIQTVLAGTDTLALLPTGGGKSICFQVPALVQPGICVVISPLIALMKDQVYQLKKRNIPAVALYSGMPYAELDRQLDNCIYGNIKFLYLSPERLHTELALERLSRMPVNLLAVDEAHCISQWGYDFRPPYLQIAAIRQLWPQVPVLALTATATREVVADIQQRLDFKAGRVFASSFARPNLAYVVRHTEDKEGKLLDILRKVPGSGVVYVRNRRRTKEIALLLRQKGISADYYHAGLSIAERSTKQDAWIQDRTRIMVSTNAFGMGIDKPNVRVVVHLELPDSLEAYFQEAGRAGRDGQKAFAVLLYHPGDARKLERQLQASFPALAEIRQVYRALGSYFQLALGAGAGQSFPFQLADFCQHYHLESATAFHALRLLEQQGWLALSDAVFTPASLHIQCSREKLYDYLLKNPRLDALIKAVLRSYQGAYTDFVFLNETKLADFLKTPLAQVQKGFQTLHRDGLIVYRPQTDQPQLTFLRARQDADTLELDGKTYQFRRQRQEEKISRAIAYCEDNVCRSQQLLHYFGQPDAPACGTCDVCLAQRQKALTPEVFERLKEKIKRLLLQEALPPIDIVASFSPKQKEVIVETLQFLQQEGWLEERQGKCYWLDQTPHK